ncbi:MAG: lysylphosphatidylglycerol synthase transmembrane domain-containing protein [Kofleriaceae bacterium]
MTEPLPAPPPRWARRFTIVASLVALAALALTLHQVGLGSVIDELRAIGGWFAALIAIEVVAAVADALAISGFLGPDPPRSSLRRVLHAQVAGRAVNLVTPFGSLGEATKATLLMRDTDSTRAVAAVARFGMVYVVVNLVVIVVGAPVCALALDLPTWLERTLWIGTGLAAALGIAGVALVRAGLVETVLRVLVRGRLVSAARRDRWHDAVARLDHGLRGGGWATWRPGLWAAVSKLVQWVAAWLVLAANGHAPSLGVMAALATAGNLINIVANVVPLGLGVTEGGTAALMAALGQPPSLGVTVAVARRAIQLLYAAVGLTLLVSAEARPWRRRPPAT